MSAENDLNIPSISIQKDDKSKTHHHSIDEAIECVETGRYHYYLLFVSGLAGIASIMELFAIPSALPSTRCDFDWTVGQEGFIRSISYIGIVCSAHLWGFLTDTYGRKKTVLLAQIITITASIISSFSTNPWLFILFRLIGGIGCCGVKVAIIAYMGEFHSFKTRERFITYLLCIQSMAASVQNLFALGILTLDFAIPLGGWIVYRPWRLYILAGNSINIIAAIFMVFLPETPMYDFIMDRQGKAMETLRRMYARNAQDSIDNYPVRAIKEADCTQQGSNLSSVKGLANLYELLRDQTVPLFRAPHLRMMILMFFLSFFIFFGTVPIETWYHQVLVYYTQYMDESVTTCEAFALGVQSINGTIAATDAGVCVTTINPLSYLMIFFKGLMFMVISVIFSWASHYFDRSYLLFIWAFLGAFASLLSIWITNIYVAVLVVLLLTSNVTSATMVGPFMCESFPIQYRGVALGFAMIYGRIGSIVGINIIGYALEGICEFVFGIESIIMLCVAIGCFYSMRLVSKKICSTNNT